MASSIGKRCLPLGYHDTGFNRIKLRLICVPEMARHATFLCCHCGEFIHKHIPCECTANDRVCNIGTSHSWLLRNLNNSRVPCSPQVCWDVFATFGNSAGWSSDGLS